MSSILRALKKLENDSAVDADIKHLPGKGKIGRIREQSVRPTAHWLMLAAFVLAAGVAVFVKFYHPSFSPSESAEPVFSSADKPVAEEKVTEPPLSAKIDKIEKRNLKKSSNSVESSAPVAASEDSSTPMVKKTDIHIKSEPEQTGAPVSAAVRDEKKDMKAEMEKARPSAAKSEPPVSTDVVFFEDSGLDLQAISWDETPAQRIAVINNRLCHEGERISGYRIIEINPDDVVISNGEKTGRLMFKIR